MEAEEVPQARSAGELKSLIEAERGGAPLLLWRDSAGAQQIRSLEGVVRLTIGRRTTNDVVLSDDGEVSRTHAELERVGEDWTVVDDGLSRNGSYLNDTRIAGRKRLRDGDVMRFGRTAIEFRSPGEGSTALTSSAAYLPTVESLTRIQREIIVALCRPYRSGAEFATPATNADIAAEVHLGVHAVKGHLRTLFQRFEIGDLQQNQKRARLVQCAFQWGLVSERDL